MSRMLMGIGRTLRSQWRPPVRIASILPLLLGLSLFPMPSYGFSSCPPSFTLLVTTFPVICMTGHYQITVAGLNFSAFGFSSDALMLVASANIGVDGSENYWGKSNSGVSEFLPIRGRYAAAHHFDRKGLSISDSAAFSAGQQYVFGLRNTLLNQLSSARTCTDTITALQMLGRALHAIQDVYSHSNYINLSLVDQNQVDLAILNPSIAPPLTFKLTGYDPDASADPEHPDGDPYSHEDFAKDFTGKNAEATAGNFAYAVNQATIESYSFVQALKGQAGTLWSKIAGFTTLSACVQNPNLPVQVITSGDPNDKTGPLGIGPSRFVSGATPLQYSIYFDNMPTASAAAQTVVVTDQIDKTRLDITTLTLGPITFVDHVITPPALPLSVAGLYSKDVDLRPSQNLIVRISATIDTNAAIVTWKFQSIDPATNQPTTEPIAGFLPPGTEGSVSFSSASQATVTTGSAIQNQATIVFDLNPPLNTPVWANTIDKTAPVSKVTAIASPQNVTSFPVSWSGTDGGSGIQDYTISVSDNGGPFAVWLSHVTQTTALYHGAAGHTYGFNVVARDLVGNVEAVNNAAEATTSILAVPVCAANYTDAILVAQGGYRYNNSTKQFLQTVTLTNTSTGPITGPISLVLDSLSPNATLANASGRTSCSSPAGSAYLNADTGASGVLASGQSISLALQFTNPSNAGITYTARVLAGPQGR